MNFINEKGKIEFYRITDQSLVINSRDQNIITQIINNEFKKGITRFVLSKVKK